MHSSRCKSPVCTKTYQICTKTYQICTKTYQICTKTYQISTKTYQICTKTYQICTKTYRICTKISFSSSLLLVFSNVNCVQIGVNFLPDLTQNNCPSIPTDVCSTREMLPEQFRTGQEGISNRRTTCYRKPIRIEANTSLCLHSTPNSTI